MYRMRFTFDCSHNVKVLNSTWSCLTHIEVYFFLLFITRFVIECNKWMPRLYKRYMTTICQVTTLFHMYTRILLYVNVAICWALVQTRSIKLWIQIFFHWNVQQKWLRALLIYIAVMPGISAIWKTTPDIRCFNFFHHRAQYVHGVFRTNVLFLFL